MKESENIFSINTTEKNTWEPECEKMVAYIIKLGFKLIISVSDNLSKNPGFEGCHGSW